MYNIVAKMYVIVEVNISTSLDSFSLMPKILTSCLGFFDTNATEHKFVILGFILQRMLLKNSLPRDAQYFSQ